VFANAANAADFAKSAVKFAISQFDEQTLATVSYSLSLLEMSKELASKLFVASAALTLFFRNGAALPLMAASLRQFGQDSNICEQIHMKMIQFLNECTTLDFATEPVYSGLLLFALFAEKGRSRQLPICWRGGRGSRWRR
jgi:hypothetical protein